MKHEPRDLEKLFAPGPGWFGTHMLLCGLSADTETLERMLAAFTGESKVERAATGLVRAVLMLDASSPPLSPLAVPGLQRLTHTALQAWTAQTSLMHAKVALLGFAEERFAAPTSFRLVVSTGNWTRETWGNGPQIDLFWSTECGTGAAEISTDAYVDASAALAFFERLMGTLYAQSAAFLADLPLAMGWLNSWRTILRREASERPARFIDSLDQSLFDQIAMRFPKEGVSTLVAGSGFYEQPSSDLGAKPEVLKRLGELTVRGQRYLVANYRQAGALAQWVAASPSTARTGRIDNWTLCAPLDPLQTKKAKGRDFLHAKYLAGLTRVAPAQQDKGTMTFLYLGSGNLSRAGLLSKAGLGRTQRRWDTGNVEAGVILNEKQEVPQVWRALACGDVLSNALIESMESGAGEPILEPQAPPPVLFAQVVDNRLSLIRSAGVTAALAVRLDGAGPWSKVGAGVNTLPLAGRVPPMVWVHLALANGGDTPEIHEVPVFTEDGVCCRQAPNTLGVDDVLDALLAFPAVPPCLTDPEMPPSPPTAAAVATSTSRYPLRLIAALVEAIGQRNAVLTQEQFPVWLSQLRYLLLEQVSGAERDAIARTGVNLFMALLEPGFAPPWLANTPRLADAYRTLVSDIAAHWTASAVARAPGIPAWVDQGESFEKQA
jgi:hypothetical protein